MEWHKYEFSVPNEEQWYAAAEKSLRGKRIEDYIGETPENITLKPLYMKKDSEKVTCGEGINESGVAVSQVITGKSALEINQNIKTALKNGQETLHLALDDATKKGNDCDQGPTEDIFKSGSSISTLEEISVIFKDIPLANYPLFMETGEAFLPFLAMLKVYASGQNVQQLKGIVGVDPLNSLATTGILEKGLLTSYDEMVEGVKWGLKEAPLLKTMVVNSNVYHHGGANGVQEMAYVLATGVEYIHECLGRGLHIDEVAPRIAFSLSAANHFFMEIAKLRGIRVLWAKVVASFGGNETSQRMYLHVNTSGRTKTRYDEHLNLLRSTTEGFAAIVGGANSLHVSPFDEANGGGSLQAERLARNVTHVLIQEAHLAKVLDPARGSYYVESLTGELMNKSWSYFQEIEACGGMSIALQEGYVGKEIQKVSQKRQENIKSGKEKIIGTNVYRKDVKIKERLMYVDEKCKRIQKVVDYKQRKNYESSFLEKGNVVDVFGRELEKGATLGQVSHLDKRDNQVLQIEAIQPMRDGEVTEREVMAQEGVTW